ncbi:TLD-domain-containing protein [Zychaea mexicana]|uniref:TLD-domain-containing protein n=1 Tax=Zychaea mexicana TaxID=64656 RepID=UPI0022FEE4FD|nr:TLD-domain-containing protein [Zychaea mexicana]KAI9492529.1 TLD-domain-containing protein [Zychaea mexicana]
MTKQQQHLSWSPAPTTATTTAYHHRHHRHHHHHHHHRRRKPEFYPLHRSITDEDSYADKPSPITRFVTKLLGLGGATSSSSNDKHQRQRPPLAHKSHSTTSITKDSSVISSTSSSHYTIHNNNNSNSNNNNNETITGTETPVSVSVIEWEEHHHHRGEEDTQSITSSNSSSSSSSNTSLDEEEKDEKSVCSERCTGRRKQRGGRSRNNKKPSLTSSVSSSSSSIYCGCVAAGIKAKNNNTFASTTTTSTSSAAVDALVSAATHINQYEEERRKRQERIVAFLDIMDPPQLVGRKEDTEPVLDRTISEKLRPYLPRRHRLTTQWSLLYSLDQHGSSLTTLYRQCRSYRGPCVLAIKDADDTIFGAFLNETLQANSASYYGTGIILTSFLWKYCKNTGNVQVFPWTGKNEYMILSETEFIAIGGGDGKFGLWINSDLEHGHSEPCPTFDNESLSRKPEFACMELEIFAVSGEL